MFEGYTLEAQRQVEVERGWKPTYSALSYCTAEGVIFRRALRTDNVLDCYILEVERTSGAPDCLGKRQGKWGTYVRPTDRNARYAFQRYLMEAFEWNVGPEQLAFASIVGPELYKSTVQTKEGILFLTVTDQQAEQTPFEAKLFCIDVTDNPNFHWLGEGGYTKSTKNARWVRVRDLIAEQGNNADYLYWTMLALCIFCQSGKLRSQNEIVSEFGPGEYKFLL